MFEDKRFEYDVYGRLVRKVSGHGPAKELALEYDDWNQSKTVVTKDRLGIATTHFEYDAFGRWVRKLKGSYASTDFLWDGMRLVQETYNDRQGEEALTYSYEANSYVPLARIDQGKPAANDADARDAVYYFHNDVSGLPEELTDAGGELVWQARYKVWGNAVQEEWVARKPQRSIPAWGEAQFSAPTPPHVPRPQNFRFQGQYLDRETGLHYNTFRFYDPDLGRFITTDPISLRGGINLYKYTPNPISWIDPWGLTGFFTPSVFTAPSGSTHTVYQQAIDWNLPVNTRNGTVTNLDLAASGKSPFVVKNGVYSQLNLHHSNQDGLGSLFELSADTHQRYYGTNALHPYLPNAHPVNPVNRDTSNLDREAYWQQRAAAEVERRKSVGRCGV